VVSLIAVALCVGFAADSALGDRVLWINVHFYCYKLTRAVRFRQRIGMSHVK
jgi:hypothetical protein